MRCLSRRAQSKSVTVTHETDQHGGYDNGIDGEDPGCNSVGEMPLLGKQGIGHRWRSAGPQGVRDHAGRNPEACALPKLVRCGVPLGTAAGLVRPASGWRQKGTLDHRFTPGAPGVPTSEVRAGIDADDISGDPSWSGGLQEGNNAADVVGLREAL